MVRHTRQSDPRNPLLNRLIGRDWTESIGSANRMRKNVFLFVLYLVISIGAMSEAAEWRAEWQKLNQKLQLVTSIVHTDYTGAKAALQGSLCCGGRS